MNLFYAMFFFSLAMSISPGPVNMIIISSGASYGIKRTMPYVSGATIGFTLLLLFTGLGFFQVINTYPFFLKYLAVGGSLFIMYIGYKIASSKPEIEVNKEGATPKFFEGFLLQWLNPKAWIACVSGASIFSSTESCAPFLVFAGIYFFVCYASLAVWAVLGYRVSFLLNSPFRLRLFNFFMGVLLMLTAGYLCFTNLA